MHSLTYKSSPKYLTNMIAHKQMKRYYISFQSLNSQKLKIPIVTDA